MSKKDVKTANKDEKAGSEQASEVQDVQEKEQAEVPKEDVQQEEEGKLEKEFSELQEKHLRLVAEFDNFRKRTAREKEDLRKSAEADLIGSLIPVLNDFERTVSVMEESDNLASLKKGVRLVAAEFDQILKRRGLQKMESKGKQFDPDYHDALQAVPVEDEKQKGTVIEVIEPGYLLKDRVIKYAKVVVGE